MSKMHSTSLLSTPWPFWTDILSQVSKNDDEKTLLLKVIWLYSKVTSETSEWTGNFDLHHPFYHPEREIFE